MSNLEQSPLAIVAAHAWSPSRAAASDEATLTQVRGVLNDVALRGRAAVEQYARQWDRWNGVDALLLGRPEMERIAADVPTEVRNLLARVHSRIERFAQAQLSSIQPLTIEVLGGQAGHRLVPVEQVGCYVPGGRYPLPSTALMTVTTAKVAGCRRIVVATPQPNPVIVAAAVLAGADQMLLVGGAQAIGALTFGIDGLPPVDLIVGPGNRWVTAAKQLVAGTVGIDMLAGPSELVVVVDDQADPHRVAHDLLAQAEHDCDARPFLITTDVRLAERVNRNLSELISASPHRETIETACRNGAAIVARDESEVVALINRLAPEHLELHVREPSVIADKVLHAGCVFRGTASAEVFGDYGIGPNHTLPTAGSARFSSGLNVMTFIRWQTWLELTTPPPEELIVDTMQLAALEGLHHHRLAAQQRLTLE